MQKVIDVPFEFVRKEKFIKLSGSREEHVLYSVYNRSVLDESLKLIADEIQAQFDLQDKVIVFASVIVAKKESSPSSFFEEHADGKGRVFVKSLTYLTNVPDISHGPLEFGGVPVLGSKGTTVVFDSETLHKGYPNVSDQDRLALTLIFTDKLSRIGLQEVGTGCTTQECDDYCSGEMVMTWCDYASCDCDSHIEKSESESTATKNWSQIWTVVIFIVIGALYLLNYFQR